MLKESHNSASRTEKVGLMPRVLYIEDNFENRLLVRRVLMASDYEFEFVETDSAITGLELARRSPPDIILMDISMPDMDGLTATRKIRESDVLKDIPVVALTANAMNGDRERALQAGCDGYITKPFDIDKLPDEVMHYVRSRNERGAKHPAARAD